jgi:DNA-binding transcriptional LysR family regulator
MAAGAAAAMGGRRFFEQALQDQARLTSVPPLAKLSSTTAIKSAVTAGAGPAVLSSLAVAGPPQDLYLIATRAVRPTN